MKTRIEVASGAALSIIENLMQLYNYDLSQWYPIQLTPDGRFKLRPKTAYWARSDVHPYLIHHAGELAGFAVIDGDVYHPDSDYSLGYFFLTRRFRGAGVADDALRDILMRHPGRWEIYHLTANIAADRFWQRVLPCHDPQLRREARQLDGDDCVLFCLDIASPSRAQHSPAQRHYQAG